MCLSSTLLNCLFVASLVLDEAESRFLENDGPVSVADRDEVLVGEDLEHRAYQLADPEAVEPVA